MTVKHLIRKSQSPPSERIAAVRIEFADGIVYEVSQGMRYKQRQARRKTVSRTKPSA
jgi:hypothetical protein